MGHGAAVEKVGATFAEPDLARSSASSSVIHQSPSIARDFLVNLFRIGAGTGCSAFDARKRPSSDLAPSSLAPCPRVPRVVAGFLFGVTRLLLAAPEWKKQNRRHGSESANPLRRYCLNPWLVQLRSHLSVRPFQVTK